jgi:2,3-bisphosphoglycerate-independent phosphoglycerate mutase
MKKIVDTALAQGGAVLITSDHGNAEEKINPTTKEISKDHTTNPVPVIYITADNKQDPPKSEDMMMQVLSTPIGCLADIGPTVLEIMQIPQPPQMTAQSILKSLV